MVTELEELRVLRETETLVDLIWREVWTWNEFGRDTVGKQITRAADSIGANVAEAYGRFHFGEKINLLYYARGSLFETKYWLNRCKTRQLISESNAGEWTQQLGEIARQINSFVSNLKTQRRGKSEKTLHEEIADYTLANDAADEIITASELEWLVSSNPYLEPPFSLQSFGSAQDKSLISSLDSL
jgi:four helix bundle protein